MPDQGCMKVLHDPEDAQLRAIHDPDDAGLRVWHHAEVKPVYQKDAYTFDSYTSLTSEPNKEEAYDAGYDAVLADAIDNALSESDVSSDRLPLFSWLVVKTTGGTRWWPQSFGMGLLACRMRMQARGATLSAVAALVKRIVIERIIYTLRDEVYEEGVEDESATFRWGIVTTEPETGQDVVDAAVNAVAAGAVPVDGAVRMTVDDAEVVADLMEADLAHDPKGQTGINFWLCMWYDVTMPAFSTGQIDGDNAYRDRVVISGSINSAWSC